MQFRVNPPGIFAALALAAGLGSALGGCANVDFDAGGQNWFQKPLDISGRNAGGYTFSELAETKQRQKIITANDLVESNGACPAPAPVAPQPPAGGQAGPQAAAPAPNTGSLLGGGIALGMSECDVVFRAGQPSAVQIGKNPNGDRNTVLTFNSGPRSGVYRFERGALVEMDGVAQTAPPPQPVKKKAASKSQKKDSSS